MLLKLITIFKKEKKQELTLKIPFNSFEEHFNKFSVKTELIEIKKFIENSLDLIDEDGNNIVHICFMCTTDLTILNYCLDILEKNKCNFKFINKKQYLPIQSLIINNPKFYENNLARIFPRLFKIYNIKDINPICEHPNHLYYLYDSFCNFLNKEEFYNFLLSQSKNEIFTYPKVIDGKEFLEKDKIKLFPSSGILMSYPFLSEKNLEDCVEEITGRKSKKFKKLVINEVINKKYVNLESIMTICKSVSNDDICLTLVNEFLERNYSPFEGEMFYLSRQSIPAIKDFMIDFTPYLFIKYFLKDDQRCSYVKDTLIGFYKLKNSYETVLDIKNYKDLKSYHDAISKEIAKNKQKPFELKQDKINYLNGKMCNDLLVSVPTHNYDLINIGAELNLCIGTFGYADRIVLDREKMIFFKDKKGIVKIVCSMNNDLIILEIKKKNNEFLNEEEKREIQSFLLKNRQN